MKNAVPELETNDDGLLMRPGGAWAYHKLHYVNEYMYRFIVSMRKKQWRAIHYIDLFAGPGRSRLDNGKIIHGSPVLALSQPPAFERYFFVDMKDAHIVALKQRCQSFGQRTERVHYFVGDANQVVDEICAVIRQKDSRYIQDVWPSLNLAFLDPEGLELHWETVAKLAAFRTDMIIYYPQMGITRNARQAPEAIDHFFGGQDWREIYRKSRHPHRALLDHYKEKLQGFGYVVEDPLPEPLFANSKDAPLYRLLFVSKHELGNKFWRDVNKKLPSGQMRLI